MKLKLRRADYRPDGIFSELKSDKGTIAKCLEHAYPVYIKTEKGMILKDKAFLPKLQPGTYTCKLGPHSLNGKDIFQTYEIMGVKDHTGILFHAGNWNKDSNGCVLLGEGPAHSDKGQMVTNSRKTFADFIAMLKGQPEFTLEVIA